jgi:hypothetical protein
VLLEMVKPPYVDGDDKYAFRALRHFTNKHAELLNRFQKNAPNLFDSVLGTGDRSLQRSFVLYVIGGRRIEWSRSCLGRASRMEKWTLPDGDTRVLDLLASWSEEESERKVLTAWIGAFVDWHNQRFSGASAPAFFGLHHVEPGLQSDFIRAADAAKLLPNGAPEDVARWVIGVDTDNPPVVHGRIVEVDIKGITPETKRPAAVVHGEVVAVVPRVAAVQDASWEAPVEVNAEVVGSAGLQGQLAGVLGWPKPSAVPALAHPPIARPVDRALPEFPPAPTGPILRKFQPEPNKLTAA